MEVRKSLRSKPESPAPSKKRPGRFIPFVVFCALGFIICLRTFDVDSRGGPLSDRLFGSLGMFGRPRGKGDQNAPDIPSNRTLFSPTDSASLSDGSNLAGKESDSLRTVRLGAWNLYPLDYGKITDREIGPRIAEVIASFDLIAISGFRAKNKGAAEGLLFRVNQVGKGRFDFVVSPSSRPNSEFQAFFFNRDRIRVDRESLFEMADPFGRLAAAPLAASFCAAGVDPARRFTFTLVSVRARSDSTPPDPEIFADVYKGVRTRVGRGGVTEDDIILLGSFEASLGRLGTITAIPNLVAAAADIPTDFRGRSVDHLIFDERSTTEYVEKFGIVNLADRFNLPAEEAGRIADHFPIWADFSVLENF